MNLKLLDFKKLKDFPSGSGIEIYDDQFYLIGDDARYILIMNKNWKMLETVNLFPSEVNAAVKGLHADCEATTILQINKTPFLLMLGSGLEMNRNRGVLMNLVTRALEEINLTDFYNRLKQSGFEELNIEAATVLDDKLILCNRGTKARPDNRLIVTSVDFWKKQQTADIFTMKVELEEKPEKNMSLTGVSYSYKNDWLILTASSENINNTIIDDGTIGDSYLCVIENASRKIDRKRLKVNESFNLTAVDKKFKGHKVESVCMQADKGQKLKLHLVTHDDNGEIFLFKLRLKE